MSEFSGAQNIRLGTCRVIYDGVDLGLTIGGVEVSVSTTTHETKADQFGETLVEETITGRNITATVPMAETTVTNLAKIMPGAELVEDLTDAQNPKRKVQVKTGVGTSLINMAKTLVLHPVALPDEDKSEDLTIHRAATPGAISFAYKTGEERTYPAEFKGYPDANGLLFTYGDESVVAA